MMVIWEFYRLHNGIWASTGIIGGIVEKNMETTVVY